MNIRQAKYLHRRSAPYNRTPTSIATGQNLGVTYDTGYLAGPECEALTIFLGALSDLMRFADNDTVTLAPDIIISNQSIGGVVAYTAWSGVDGVLGVGPVALTVGSLSPNITSLVPTVMDNARKQGLIQQQIMSVSFAPASTDNETSEDRPPFELNIDFNLFCRRNYNFWRRRFVTGKPEECCLHCSLFDTL